MERPAARKSARTGGGGEDGDEEPVPVADGFEAPIFGARVLGQVTTLTLEGEDGPLASLSRLALASRGAPSARGSLARTLVTGHCHHCAITGTNTGINCPCFFGFFFLI